MVERIERRGGDTPRVLVAGAIRLVRCLRARFAAAHPGGPGTRPGGITTALQGACWTGTDGDGDIALRVPGSADPAPVGRLNCCPAKPQWSAERRGVSSHETPPRE